MMATASGKTATLYRMVMDEHTCPYGLKSKDLLEREGYEVEDHHLTTRSQTDAFMEEQGVETTPQTWIGDERIGGYDDLREHFGKAETGGGTSYKPVIAIFAMAGAMAVAMGCTHIFLDHLSIVISGIGGGDERRLLDNTMTKLRSLVEELQISLIVVSHLKRPEGRSHEEGGQVSLSHLRGSGSIAQLSDICIALERDQQDEARKNLTTLRVLKNRYTGDTGEACTVSYCPNTGLLTEYDEENTDDIGF